MTVQGVLGANANTITFQNLNLAAPVQLSDPDVQLADMNGDGLPDIVRVRRGDIRYWQGRGNAELWLGFIDVSEEFAAIKLRPSRFHSDRMRDWLTALTRN